jgi:hypothetical protein
MALEEEFKDATRETFLQEITYLRYENQRLLAALDTRTHSEDELLPASEELRL